MSAEINKLYEKIPHLLKTELERIKLKSPKFSMRSFAKKLNISQSELSEVINKKRKPSARLIFSIYKMLGKQHPHFLEESKKLHSLGIKKKKREKDLVKIEEEQFKLIADWYNLALLSLMETNDFRNDIHWIASRLNITAETAKGSIQRLLQLNLIKDDGDGNLTLSNEGIKTPDNILCTALRETHFNDLKLVQKALESSAPVDLRDFTSCTYAVNIKNIPKLKNMVRKFQDQLALLLEDSEASEVYKLSIYFYPLTQLKLTTKDKSK